MNFFKHLFRRNFITCPRCLGKGNVDLNDIRRLKKELVWGVGKCAYCNGVRLVHPNQIAKVEVDLDYLITDLPSKERELIIIGDHQALNRATVFKEEVQTIIEEIRHFYYIDNKEPDEIVDLLAAKYGRFRFRSSDREEIIEYILKVIKPLE